MSSTTSTMDFSRSMDCPVEFVRLTSPFVLVPCGHTISEIAVKKIFRGIQEGDEQSEGTLWPCKEGVCPLCDIKVSQFVINWTLKTVIENAVKVSKENFQLENEPEGVIIPPYLGVPGSFFSLTHNWKPNCKEFKFTVKSENKNSLIQYLQFVGNKNGTIKLIVGSRNSEPYFAEYFTNLGFFVDRSETYVACAFHPQAEKLFEIVRSQNQFLVEHINFFRCLVRARSWKNLGFETLLDRAQSR